MRGLVALACTSGNFPKVRSLVKTGSSIDYCDEDGWTPAICCCLHGYPEILQFILDHGANAELADKYGWNPLYFAAAGNNITCVAVLIRHKVNLDATNIYGATALYVACWRGYMPIVRLLVESGADVEKANFSTKTPISIAERRVILTYLFAERKWKRRKSYATVLNSLKGAPTYNQIFRVFQCYDLARVIGTYL